MSFFTQYYFIANTVENGYVLDVNDGPERIYAQYRNKPKAVKWYSITRQLAAKISDAGEKVRNLYDIDSASGEQLDIIGRIVVVSRNYVENIQLNPGLFALTDGDEFGDMSAQFSGLTIDSDADMSDELFRLVIKSKIIKNNSDGTIDSILRGINFLLPNANVIRLTDGEDMSYSVEFYGTITSLQRWALLNGNLIPKPQGVRFNGFLEGLGYVEFDNQSEQFGDETAEFVGLTGGN